MLSTILAPVCIFLTPILLVAALYYRAEFRREVAEKERWKAEAHNYQRRVWEAWQTVEMVERRAQQHPGVGE